MKEIKKSNNKPKQLQEVDGEIINYSIPKWIDYLVKKVAEIEENIDPEIIENLQNQIDGLQVKVDTNTGNIEDIIAEITAIDLRIDVLEGKIDQEIQDRIDGDLAIQNQVNLNTENIDDLEQLIIESAQYAIEGNAVLNNPTIPEGTWTTIVWNITLNNFTNITYNADGSFTLTEEIENLTVDIYGQSDTTGQNKEVQLRIYDVVNSAPFGGVASETINNSGSVNFVDRVTLPAGTYRYEITSSTGGGNITFTNGLLSMLKNGIGVPVDLSATFADGENVSDVRWDSKLDVTRDFESTTSGIGGTIDNGNRQTSGSSYTETYLGQMKSLTGAAGTTEANIGLRVGTDGKVNAVARYKDSSGSLVPVDTTLSFGLTTKEYVDTGLTDKIDSRQMYYNGTDTYQITYDSNIKFGIIGATSYRLLNRDATGQDPVVYEEGDERYGFNAYPKDGLIYKSERYTGGVWTVIRPPITDGNSMVDKKYVDDSLKGKLDSSFDGTNGTTTVQYIDNGDIVFSTSSGKSSYLETKPTSNEGRWAFFDGGSTYTPYALLTDITKETDPIKNQLDILEVEKKRLELEIEASRETISNLLFIVDSLNVEVLRLKTKIGE